MENKLTFSQAQGMNRAERRRLGKMNGVKIPGASKPYIKPKKK